MSQITTETIDEKTSRLTLTFTADETISGEPFTCTTQVAGDEAAAAAYAPFFEADMRRQYADLFPTPEPIVAPDDPFGNETGGNE